MHFNRLSVLLTTTPDRVFGTAFLLPSVIRHCRCQSSESCWKPICLFNGRGAGDLWTGALEMYWLTNCTAVQSFEKLCPMMMMMMMMCGYRGHAGWSDSSHHHHVCSQRPCGRRAARRPCHSDGNLPRDAAACKPSTEERTVCLQDSHRRRPLPQDGRQEALRGRQ